MNELLRIEDRLGRNGLRYAYDVTRWMTTLTDYDDSTLDYTYDAAGNVTNMDDYHGNDTSYTYDDAGRLSSMTAPGSKTWNFSYNALNQPTQETLPNGMACYPTHNRSAFFVFPAQAGTQRESTVRGTAQHFPGLEDIASARLPCPEALVRVVLGPRLRGDDDGGGGEGGGGTWWSATKGYAVNVRDAVSTRTIYKYIPSETDAEIRFSYYSEVISLPDRKAAR